MSYVLSSASTALSAGYGRQEASERCQARGQHWRLPSQQELLTLVDPTRHAPAFDDTLFLASPSLSLGYWSSTISASDASFGLGVQFDDGSPTSASLNSPQSVRCVR